MKTKLIAAMIAMTAFNANAELNITDAAVESVTMKYINNQEAMKDSHRVCDSIGATKDSECTVVVHMDLFNAQVAGAAYAIQTVDNQRYSSGYAANLYAQDMPCDDTIECEKYRVYIRKHFTIGMKKAIEME